jgi:hypothetical protein
MRSIDDIVYDTISDNGPVSVKDIADITGLNLDIVHKSLNELIIQTDVYMTKYECNSWRYCADRTKSRFIPGKDM